MKIIFRIGFAACLCISLVGLAVGQDYYGGYYPNQGQGYGAYGSSGYDQTYPNYGRGLHPLMVLLTVIRDSLGLRVIRRKMDMINIPAFQATDDMIIRPMGQVGNLPSASPQEGQPTLRSRLAPPIGRAGRPDVRESTRVVTPSRNQARAVQRPPLFPLPETPKTGRSTAMRFTGMVEIRIDSDKMRIPLNHNRFNQLIKEAVAARLLAQTRRYARLNRFLIRSSLGFNVPVPNVVRQETKSASTTPPPPPASDFKWGKEQADARQQATESRQSFKWGMQGKPSMVGSEPGRSNSNQPRPQVSAQDIRQDASNTIDSGAKKFQWGRVQ